MMEQILEKALELFKRYGLRSVTMDEVATQCGISKKTLYQHFSDKDTLITTVLERLIRKSEEMCIIQQKQSENAVHEVFKSLELVQSMFEGINPVMLYDLHKYHLSAYKSLENYKQRFLYDNIRTNLERGIAEGLFRPEINVEVISLLHLHNIDTLFERESFTMHKYSLLEVQAQIMLHYVYGLATAKGVKQIEKYEARRLKAGSS